MTLRPHHINKTSHFVAGWYSDDHSIIDEINNYYDQRKLSGDIVAGMSGSYKVDVNAKESFDINLVDNVDLWAKYVYEYLDPVKEQYLDLYPHANKVWTWNIDPCINVQEYPMGGNGFNHWHAERTHKETIDRHLVFMTYLNDVADGGETCFLYQDLQIKPEKGLTLIFPSEWTHTHKGKSSPSIDKRIATGWWRFDWQLD
jgi:hypothetical protein